MCCSVKGRFPFAQSGDMVRRERFFSPSLSTVQHHTSEMMSYIISARYTVVGRQWLLSLHKTTRTLPCAVVAADFIFRSFDGVPVFVRKHWGPIKFGFIEVGDYVAGGIYFC